jgi:hypothetical protein
MVSLLVIHILGHMVAGFSPSAFLPPLLRFENGTSVANAQQWYSGRRNEVSSLVQTVITGTLPTEPPSLINVSTINTTKLVGGFSTFVELTFNTAAASTLTVQATRFIVEIFIPNETPSSKLPVFLTQWNHREWALVGYARGYLSVIYPGADTRDVAPAFQEAYKANATMQLIIARAFVASRTLDYVLTLPNVDTAKVCITGHSRNGKQSLLAAAFDERITAVVGSSPGAPISSPYHFSSNNFYGEGPPSTAMHERRKWWLPSTANYTAHPETLPIDGHGVLALIAPRVAAVAHG